MLVLFNIVTWPLWWCPSPLTIQPILYYEIVLQNDFKHKKMRRALNMALVSIYVSFCNPHLYDGH